MWIGPQRTDVKYRARVVRFPRDRKLDSRFAVKTAVYRHVYPSDLMQQIEDRIDELEKKLKKPSQKRARLWIETQTFLKNRV